MSDDPRQENDAERHRRTLDEIKSKQRRPLGGAPMPSIPSFDKMEEAERQQRERPVGSAPVMSEERYAQMVQEGQAIPGVGGAYAANQPGMANSDKRAETEEGLMALAEANRGRKPASPPEPQQEEEEAPEAEPDEPENPLEDLPPDMMSAFQVQLMEKRKNDQRREEIEERCPPLDLEAILLSQEARQVVPIVPVKFEAEFRSLSGQEDLWVQDTVWKSSLGDTSDLHYRNSIAMHQLALGLVALNGKPLPECRTADGGVDKAKASEKLAYILKFPMPVLAELSVNQMWFDGRIRKLFDFESVKNG